MTYNGNYPYYLVNRQQANIPQNNTQPNLLYYYPNSNRITNYSNNTFSNNSVYKPTQSNKQIIYSNNYPNNYYIKTEPIVTQPIINNPIIYNKDYNNIYTFNNQIQPNNNTFIDNTNSLSSNYDVIQNFQPNVNKNTNANTFINYELENLGIDTSRNVKEKPIQIINNNNELYSQFYSDKPTTINQNQALNPNLQKYQNINNQGYTQELTTDLNQITNPNTNLTNIYPQNQINNEVNTINQDNTNIIEITNEFSNLQINKVETKKRPLNSEDYQNIHLSGIGIINLGNTCFMNSCLQILIHCKLFIHEFFNKSSIINKETTPISYEFLLICISMLDNKNDNERYIDISNFREVFGKKHPIFNDYSQNDSQEFCRVFLEDLSMELNEVKNKTVYKALTNSEGKSKILRDKEFDLNFRGREESIITKLFYSQIINTFTCQCGSEIYSFQKLLDFPLLLPPNINEIDIYTLIKIYFKTEIIDFESKCERCKKIAKHKKTMKISRPPEILIICLQRIDTKTQQKNECLVNFPEFLNLNEFIDQDCGFGKESEYKLFSVVNHQGIVDCGHYFSYIQPLGSKNWFEFNDSSVRHVKEGLKSFPYAYALFYIKKKYLKA